MTSDAKGPTKDCFVVKSPLTHSPYYVVANKDGWEVCKVAHKKDADIISDAFNVYAETGLTPRELMEERDRMRGIIARNTRQRLEGEEATTMHVTVEDIAESLKILYSLSPEKKEPKP